MRKVIGDHTMFSRTASKFRNTRRLLSTISSQIPGTRTSKLPNGLTIATEYIPNTSSATVGIFVDAGSRAENVKKQWYSAFSRTLGFQGYSE